MRDLTLHSMFRAIQTVVIPTGPWVIASVFLLAAAIKTSHLLDFLILTSTMSPVPQPVRVYLPIVIPLAELALAAGLVLKSTRKVALFGSVLLLCGFSTYLILLLRDPKSVSCACFGALKLGSTPHQEALFGLTRNALLILVALLAIPPKRTFVPTTNGFTKRPHAHTAGFTLLELVVVIGLIGIIVSILVPVVNMVSRRAKVVACASNLHQLGVMTNTWAGSHDGYIPLDGSVVIPAIPRVFGMNSELASALGDPARRRYAYHFDTSGAYLSSPLELPTPFVVAIVSSALPAGAQLNPSHAWSRNVSRFPALRVVQCPAVDYSDRVNGDWIDGVFEGARTLLYVTGDIGYTPFWLTSDYAPNGGLLGFHHASDSLQRRYRGNTSRVRNASTMVLLADTRFRFQGVQSLVPALTGPENRVTLANALADDGQMWPYGFRFDRRRHNDAANVLFLDGHVATIPITSLSLQQCNLLEP